MVAVPNQAEAAAARLAHSGPGVVAFNAAIDFELTRYLDAVGAVVLHCGEVLGLFPVFDGE